MSKSVASLWFKGRGLEQMVSNGLSSCEILRKPTAGEVNQQGKWTPSVGGGARFVRLLNSWESSLPLVSLSLPMARVKELAHLRPRPAEWAGPSVLLSPPVAGVQGLKTRLSTKLIRVRHLPIPGDFLAVDFVWSTKCPRSATLAGTLTHQAPCCMGLVTSKSQ